MTTKPADQTDRFVQPEDRIKVVKQPMRAGVGWVSEIEKGKRKAKPAIARGASGGPETLATAGDDGPRLKVPPDPDGGDGAESRAAGGPGSGNFGHAGRPGEVGGSNSDSIADWSDIKIQKEGGYLFPNVFRNISFHGTVDSALKSIKENGLVPAAGKGGDAWAEKHMAYKVAEFKVGDRTSSVFLASDSKTADIYARYAEIMNPGAKAVKLVVQIPKSYAHKLRGDEHDNQAKRFVGTIPPEWIRVLGPNNELKALEDGGETFYIIVLAKDAESRSAGGPGSGNFGHAGRPGQAGGSSSDETPHGEKGLYVHPEKTNGPLPPRGKRLASFTDEHGYTVSILGGTPKGEEYGLGVPRYGIFKVAKPGEKDGVRGGYWMGWPEKSWGIAENDYAAMSWEDKAALEVKHHAESYGGLQAQYESNVEHQHYRNEARTKKTRTARQIEPLEDDPRTAIAVRKKFRSETIVHKAADDHVEPLSKAIGAALAGARAQINSDGLRKALQSGRPKEAQDAVSHVPDVLKKHLKKLLPDVLHLIVVGGGHAGAEILRGMKLRAAEAAEIRDLKKDAYLDFGFNDKDTAARDWAEEHAAELAEDLSDTTRQAIAEALVEAFEGGDLREMEDAIIAAVGDETRGILIARTESMKAANEGQRQAWDQAVEKGYLGTGQKREWITVGDDKVCPECESLDGVTTGIGEPYPDPGGYGPPMHPRCRCTEGISAG